MQGGNPIEIMGLNWPKIGSLLYTGPTSGARINGPPIMMVVSFGLNAENTVLYGNGGQP